jgi:hypothetical protein
MPLGDDDAARQLKLLAKLGPEKAIADIRKTMEDHPLKDNVPDQADVARKGKSGEKAEKKTEDATKKDSTPAKPAKGKKAKAPKEPKDKKMSALDADRDTLNGFPLPTWAAASAQMRSTVLAELHRHGT